MQREAAAARLAHVRLRCGLLEAACSESWRSSPRQSIETTLLNHAAEISPKLGARLAVGVHWRITGSFAGPVTGNVPVNVSLDQ